MELPSLPLGSWHTVLVALAVELGCFSPALLTMSYWTNRRWPERLLALVPAAAFAWILLLARDLQAQITYWPGYLTFAAYYYQSPAEAPLALQVQQEYRRALDAANHQGWAAIFLTEAIVLLSGALLIRWRVPQRLATIRSEPPALIPQDDALEITFEPLDRAPSR